MVISGLVLITVCLANVLTAQAECCKCDCQQSHGLPPQPQLYYLPAVPPYTSSVSHRLSQSSGNAEVTDAVAGYNYGFQATGSNAEYSSGGRQGVENSLDVKNKLGSEAIAMALQKASQQAALSYKGQGLLDSESSLSSDNFKQQQVSKVSTHQDNHFINIEQKISPQDSSSGEDANSLEHEKGHDHGKNDYYKFEYRVNDQHTHDVKSHKEEKKGDVVQGEYSLLEDDGNVRTVKYYADWKTGFHAQVHNSKSNALG